MKTLFISTYDELITIGLLIDDKLVNTKERISERSHSENLVPLIDNILAEAKIVAKDLNEIIAINGPGSFTGVRLGITVAKTLAYTIGIPIKLISSIEAIGISNVANDKKLVQIKDPKGSYFGIFINNELDGEIKYLNNSEFKIFLEENKDLLIINDKILDIERINQFLKSKSDINPHEVKPIYIKQIEVMNGK